MQTLIAWNNSYLMGYELIDKQHEKLVGLINKLYNAFLEGKANSVVGEIIGEMIEYTEYHFGVEEKIFEKIDYDKKQEHIKFHRFFIDKTKSFQSEFNTGNAMLSYEVMEFLKKWLLEHIQTEDRKYINYLLKNNLI